ncbi:hypothetical protein Dacet_2240 [Denitrovibrio acetiphilus DSM 12809]|uniref:Uncharacterized protein n=2 Tax=Denitrovibrio TaxID=117999 RepID=D4H2X9_DENA2|nr:hypothetical protein Dacet_2240 [Denitrovibrio acetiphilus DSM 12809]
MLLYSGSSVPATPLFAGGGKSGSLRITTPFIITQGGEIMCSLSLSDTITIPAVRSMYGTLTICPLSAETVCGKLNIPVSLSGTNSPTENIRTITSLGSGNTCNIAGELSPYADSSLSIKSTIGDFSTAGTHKVMLPMGRTSHSNSLDIPLPQTTGRVITDKLAVFADGKDITKLFISGQIKLFGGNEALTLSAELTPHGELPEVITIMINSSKYTFEVKTCEIQPGKCRLTGSASVAEVTITPSTITAAKLCADNTEIIFSACDFVTADISGCTTEHKLAQMLAEMSGADARQMPDGRSMIFVTNRASPVYKPENILSWSKTSADKNMGSVEVIYGKSGDNYITLVPSAKTARTSAMLRIYGKSGLSVKAEGGAISRLSTAKRETVTEEIILEEGSGKLTYPALKVITSGVTTDGKKIKTDKDCIRKRVTYETAYDLYRIKADSPEVTVCVYLENRVVIISNTGDTKTITAENICDYTTAYRIAKAALDNKKGRLRLVTTHSELLNTPAGLNINTPYGEGVIRSATINIKNNPVMITDTLEVL